MTIKVNLRGFEDIENSLVEFETMTGKTAIGRGVLRRVAVAALKPVIVKMQARAPKDSGTLAGSMTIQNAPRYTRGKGTLPKTTVALRAGPAPKGAGNRAIAYYQEIGTPHHPAQPYARPTIDEERDAVLQRVLEGLRPEIAKTADRIRRKAKRK